MAYKHESNPNRGMHMLVERRRGKAKEYVCVEGGDHHTAHDWAHMHGTDREDYNNYQPMCRKHHNEYDRFLAVEGERFA